jgi:hypothetical protein
MNDWFLDFPLLKRKASAREKFSSGRTVIARVGQNPAVNGFKCIHCRGFICTERVLSSVNNRNHCPYCLWSRHLDHRKAGDRLSACKAPMQPLGLTLKKNNKKYGPARSGELMLIHVCQDCGKVSLNRIAADDDVEKVIEVYTQSFKQDLSTDLSCVLWRCGYPHPPS